LKAATWNVNSLRVRLDHVLEWLDHEQPEILALQETKLKDEDFPIQAFTERGYQSAFAGQGGYNGVALLTRSGIDEVATEIDGFADPQRRVLSASLGELRIFNLYVPNGQRIDSDKYAYKLEWLRALRDQLQAELRRHRQILVVGDFNIAPGDADVYDPQAWEGQVLCSAPERAALQDILALGFKDVFRLFDQPEGSYSWWDYRAAAFRRNRGLRIDLILASEALGPKCRSCKIDREPRGWDRPSDHAPVVVDMDVATV
jgi:exodeoxyribonuclease-3